MVNQSSMPSGSPSLDPQIGDRAWADLRRRMLALAEHHLGSRWVRHLVRSQVILSRDDEARDLARADTQMARRGRTRLGGHPLLDSGTRWPCGDDRQPLSFLAVVDCNEIAALGVLDTLPESGLLNFFYDIDNDAAFRYYATDEPSPANIRDVGWRGWRVVPAAADAVEAPPPTGRTVVSPERAVRCIHTLPWLAETAGYDFDLPGAVRDGVGALVKAWEALDAPLWPEAWNTGRPDHQIGGWPAYFQGPIWTTPDWRLLLQLNTDDELNWCWGDAGTLYFASRDDDLRTRDYRGTWVMGQSH